MFVRGRVVSGDGDFRVRMTNHPEVFQGATGQTLYPGTLNIQVDAEIEVKEDFRILGAELGEPAQDLLFENCRINGVKAFRIRPYCLSNGLGGHGDHILEIVSRWIPEATLGTEVELEFFRDDAD